MDASVADDMLALAWMAFVRSWRKRYLLTLKKLSLA